MSIFQRMTSISLFLCLPSILAFTQNSVVRNIDVASLSSTKLYGGYDSVVGADPNTPIQVYVSSGSIEELSTLIVLHELDLNYELIDVVEPKPDWFLRVHPEGSTPALRNPVDSDDIIYNSFDQEVNQYLCNVYETLTNSTCPIRPQPEESNADDLDLYQEFFDNTTEPICLSYLDNSDQSLDEIFKKEMELSFSIFEEQLETSQGPWLLGESFTLLDINMMSSLLSVLVDLKETKGYQVSQDSFPNFSRWLMLCADRAAAIEDD